jgi:RNA polymerase sigma-70 factor (ECF subfamily)
VFGPSAQPRVGERESPRSDAGGERVEVAIAAARAAWPWLTLPDEMLSRHVAERAGSELAPPFVADLCLACALLHGVAPALELFERDHLGGARAKMVQRLRGAGVDVEDALQDLRERLLVARADRPAAITRYSGRAPLGAWLAIVADRHALRAARAARATTGRVDSTEDVIEAALADDADPELSYLRDTYVEPFRRGLTAALASLTPRQRTLLQMRLVAGLAPEQIARIYRVHRTTVIRWLVDTRDVVRSSARAHLMNELALGSGEVSSLIRLVRSQLPGLLSSQLRRELG